jgi:hypothetical protein
MASGEGGAARGNRGGGRSGPGGPEVVVGRLGW